MQEKHPRGGKPWKITLAALVGVFLVAMAASMIIAARNVSRVVDPDYYVHGLHYGETHDRRPAETDGNASGGKR